MSKSPFAISTSKPGHGKVHLSLLPPADPVLRTLSYSYPLKLVSSTPHKLDVGAPKGQIPGKDRTSYPEDGSSPSRPKLPTQPSSVPLLFMLSYGGGLLPLDVLSLDLTLDACTRLTITTQGSTKIFPSTTPVRNKGNSGSVETETAIQKVDARLASHAALLLSPDPSQPFALSKYSQTQRFYLADRTASLCVLDWVVEGRRARGESWEASSWKGKNEVWLLDRGTGDRSAVDGKPDDGHTLLLRDNVLLTDGAHGTGHSSLRQDGLGVFGTIILAGPLFASLADFFIEEFAALPRIGGRDWGDGKQSGCEEGEQSPAQRLEIWRKTRVEAEAQAGLLWTAARVRGLVLVKFAAKEVEGARTWLGGMWKREGTIDRELGPGGTMSLR